MKNNKYSYSKGSTEIARVNATQVEKTIINLNDFYVLPKYRGRGLGTSLLKLVIEDHDMYTLELGVRQDNETAIKMYKKFRFKVESEFEENGQKMYRMLRKTR